MICAGRGGDVGRAVYVDSRASSLEQAPDIAATIAMTTAQAAAGAIPATRDGLDSNCSVKYSALQDAALLAG